MIFYFIPLLYDDVDKLIVLDWEFTSYGSVLCDLWQLLCYLWIMKHDSRYDIVKVNILFDYLLDYVVSQNVSSTDIKWHISTFLVNFALIFEETKHWSFTEANKLQLVNETAVFIERQLTVN